MSECNELKKCRQCSNLAEKGKSCCRVCLDRNKAKMKSWTDSHRKEKICVGCSKPALPNKRKCQDCYDKWNAKRNERRKKRKAEGVCIECDQPPMPGFIRCEKHHKVMTDSTQHTRDRRMEQGLCLRCGKEPQPAHSVNCETCLLKAVAHSLWKDRRQWKPLFHLLVKQDRLCVYSGRKLLLGRNASIDHIIPSAKGGLDDISNLQWVDLDVNKMKQDLSERDFLNLVKDIAEHEEYQHELQFMKDLKEIQESK